jgi:DNA/RNA endonuclease YhcR with UshA esterase domain
MAFKHKAVYINLCLRVLCFKQKIQKQHEILNEVAKTNRLGMIKTTLAENFGTINAENFTKSSRLLETGKAIKIVLEGF